jgi:hypothetical protein
MILEAILYTAILQSHYLTIPLFTLLALYTTLGNKPSPPWTF